MYTLSHSTVIDESGEKWDTYGIRYGENVINDISIDRIKIEKLIEVLNRQKLSPIHIYDVIEDFMVDFNVWQIDGYNRKAIRKQKANCLFS